MWNLLARLGAGSKASRGKQPGAIDSVLRALGEGEAARPMPTLVCRTCNLKYRNAGTYLHGSRCPACHPNG
jgi:hypothetical protein